MRFLIAALVLLIYLLFLTKTYYWDGVLFSIYIESAQNGTMPASVLLHPNHLLYSAFGFLLYDIVMQSGAAIRAITILQVANAILSAYCTLVVFSLAQRLTSSRLRATFAMVLFAFGATWWKFSTDADAYVISVLLCLGAVWFVMSGGRGSLIAAAACHALGMLFHEL
ncbi:MAG: hypothetical protein JO061_05505, partial [Acidobacteriaceae bacterium]|nr:hypothetical protein [Acidobacteriaceae bacterium]